MFRLQNSVAREIAEHIDVAAVEEVMQGNPDVWQLRKGESDKESRRL